MSRNTVMSAYHELQIEGWVVSAPGEGSAVARRIPAGASNGWVSANRRPSGSSDNAALLVADIPGSSFLTNSTIEYSAGHGIDATWAARAINSPDIAAGNTFASIAGCKQTFNAKAGGTCPSLGCTEP